MKILVLMVLVLSGCEFSVHPFPSVSQKDFASAMSQLQANDQLLAQKIAELAPNSKKETK